MKKNVYSSANWHLQPIGLGFVGFLLYHVLKKWANYDAGARIAYLLLFAVLIFLLLYSITWFKFSPTDVTQYRLFCKKKIQWSEINEIQLKIVKSGDKNPLYAEYAFIFKDEPDDYTRFEANSMSRKTMAIQLDSPERPSEFVYPYIDRAVFVDLVEKYYGKEIIDNRVYPEMSKDQPK